MNRANARTVVSLVVVGVLCAGSACRKNSASKPATASPSSPTLIGSGSAAPIPVAATMVDATRTVAVGSGQRIFIMGASVSAGMGGLTFLDAFKAAAPRGEVASAASIMLFRDPKAATLKQAAHAADFKPSIVIALDLLFWDAYGFAPQAARRRAIADALAALDRLHAAGAIIVVGDIPRIVTASPMMLSPEAVPPANELAELNAELAAWAGPGKFVAPFAAWATPLAANAAVTMPDGARVMASTLMAADGLHANPRGTYYVLSLLDHWLEARGVPADDFVFVAPAP